MRWQNYWEYIKCPELSSDSSCALVYYTFVLFVKIKYFILNLDFQFNIFNLNKIFIDLFLI